MGRITADQSQAVMAAFSTNVDWASIDFEVCGLQDSAIRRATEAGAQFAAFLRNGCRLVEGSFLRKTGELSISIPALSRPTLKQLKKKWPWIKKIAQDTSPTCPVTLELATVLLVDENDSIDGSEYERRLTPNPSRLLGYQQCEWLIEHRDEYPAFATLLGKVYIEFPGLVVVDDDGNRRGPHCLQVGRRWGASWSWFIAAFNQSGRVAISDE